MSEHTILPWRRVSYRVASVDEKVVASCIPDSGAGFVCPKSDDECIANADLIVRAVNSHGALLEACRKTMVAIINFTEGKQVDWFSHREALRAAIEAAEGANH